MNKFLIFILRFSAASCMIILIGCDQTKAPTIEELREQEINRRLNQFISSNKDECHQTTLDLAVHKADSLLKLNAIKYKEDDLERPPLPEKPARDLKPPPKDSIRNIPFLRKKDSLRLFGPDSGRWIDPIQ